MGAVADKTLLTPEDLLAMPDEKSYELIDGKLVERNMGVLSSWVGGRLYRQLAEFVEGHDLGWVFPADVGFQCFPGSTRTVRKTDVAFIRSGRFPGEQLPEGYSRIAPDLAVEVISPNDLAYKVDEKVDAYLKAGVRLVWVAHPHTRTVLIYRSDGSVGLVREADELSGEDVVPGFRCPVAAIFPPEPSPAAGNPT
ncbi:MAG: Uma2 family endonuclease [Planctomycetaceae bacterium]|nr:Uma2 family endonuclease [Planctomycetaceae bacterium]